MPVLNFQAQFADEVESGRKRQTIRAMRKQPFCAGDTLHLWTGLRRPGARPLGIVTCRNVISVAMDRALLSFGNCVWFWDNPIVDYLAAMDGFADADKLYEFFSPRFPFEGQLLYW